MPPEHGDRPLLTTAHFTGMTPPPWSGPKGWEYALSVYPDDEDDEDDEDDQEAEDDENAGHDVKPGGS